MSDSIIRIAMWSGPRNISTAMMRSWENRSDTAVVDEPFYACFLQATGIVHPMQEEVLASQSTNWDTVVDQVLTTDLSTSLPTGLSAGHATRQAIQYQKHMTQHMVSELNEEWFSTLRHAFLIRHPAEVVASYAQKRDQVNAEDIGFARQREIFELAQSLGFEPPVIESRDVLMNPGASLRLLCSALDVPFDEHMLSWPVGTRESDGVWAPHWYESVENSTHFAPYVEKEISLNRQQQNVVDECLDDYLALKECSL